MTDKNRNKKHQKKSNKTIPILLVILVIAFAVTLIQQKIYSPSGQNNSRQQTELNTLQETKQSSPQNTQASDNSSQASDNSSEISGNSSKSSGNSSEISGTSSQASEIQTEAQNQSAGAQPLQSSETDKNASDPSDLQTNTSVSPENSPAATPDSGQININLKDLNSLIVPLCQATVTHQNGHDHEVHTYTGFQLCYRETYEIPEWVSYCLTKEMLVKETERSNKFRSDVKISTQSAAPSDYTNSGYDRGHLAPAADMEWSKDSEHDCFLMSNMTPQAPDFNRGMWKKLEEQVRKWAERYGTVYVVTGPVLEKESGAYNSIGKNKVAVPEYFYKVLLIQPSENEISGIGFILPNEKCPGTIYDYALPIDSVEQRTSLDFFAALPDPIETQVESEVNLKLWQ